MVRLCWILIVVGCGKSGLDGDGSLDTGTSYDADADGSAMALDEDGDGDDGGSGSSLDGLDGDMDADGGDADGGSSDGGSSDGGSSDGGSSDGGSSDGGSSDGGSSDGGGDDGGVPSTPCPDGVICFDDFPATHDGNTATSSLESFDSYSCAPGTSEAGPEVLYRLTVSEPGLLALELTNMGSGADVDVHLLGSESASDCISRGHWVAGGFVEAGEYWVTADSWTSGGTEYSGSYTLNMGFTAVSDLEGMGMDEAPAEDALYAMGVAFENEDPDHLFFAITDFSLHSSEPRLWVIDLIDGSLLWNLHVTHGEHSSSGDSGWSDVFSNINESHQSSLGMMKGAELYSGSFDNSMRIDGMEPGYNDLVRPRAIVMHGATYARASFVADYGRAGESWGCPALDDTLVEDVIGVLSDGSMMFFWYPDGDWSVYSDYLR
jgi:hypothetical protein